MGTPVTAGDIHMLIGNRPEPHAALVSRHVLGFPLGALKRRWQARHYHRPPQGTLCRQDRSDDREVKVQKSQAYKRRSRNRCPAERVLPPYAQTPPPPPPGSIPRRRCFPVRSFQHTSSPSTAPGGHCATWWARC